MGDGDLHDDDEGKEEEEEDNDDEEDDEEDKLGGGFKYFLCSPLFGEAFQFDDHIFQMGGSTTNQIKMRKMKMNQAVAPHH